MGSVIIEIYRLRDPTIVIDSLINRLSTAPGSGWRADGSGLTAMEIDKLLITILVLVSRGIELNRVDVAIPNVAVLAVPLAKTAFS
jgi:hypothetical protein